MLGKLRGPFPTVIASPFTHHKSIDKLATLKPPSYSLQQPGDLSSHSNRPFVMSLHFHPCGINSLGKWFPEEGAICCHIIVSLRCNIRPITHPQCWNSCISSTSCSIGSLGKGSASGCVSNVTVSNTILENTLYGLRIKTYQGGKGLVQDVDYRNIWMSNVSQPITIDQVRSIVRRLMVVQCLAYLEPFLSSSHGGDSESLV